MILSYHVSFHGLIQITVSSDRLPFKICFMNNAARNRDGPTLIASFYPHKVMISICFDHDGGGLNIGTSYCFTVCVFVSVNVISAGKF